MLQEPRDVDDGEAGPDRPRLDGASDDDGGQQPEIARILRVHVDPKLIERYVLLNLRFLIGLVSRSEFTKGKYLGLIESAAG